MEKPPPLPEAEKPSPAQGGWKVRSLNAYLGVFTATGAVGALAHTLAHGTVQRAMDALGSLGEVLSILLAVWALLLLGSFKRLPWRPLAPALLLTLWKSFLLLPAPAYISWDSLERMGAFTQLLTGACTLAWIRRKSASGSPWLATHPGGPPVFSWTRTFLAFAAKVLLGVPLLVVYVLLSAQILIKELSAGFLEVDSHGIYTESRTYEREGRMIYLLPTVHIGSPAFYDKLLDSLPEKHSVILPEGVSDRLGLLKARIDYSATADSVGLSAQPDLTERRKEHAVLHCDADVSEFSPRTQELLALLGKLMQMHSLAPEEMAPVLLSLQSFQNADLPVIAKDILESRNAKVLAGLNLALEKYEHIAIPWGAAHMPGIERELLKLPARRIERRRVEVLKWSDLRLPAGLLP